MTIHYIGCDFIQMCSISPFRDATGRIIEYLPQQRYQNEKGLSIHQYGRGPFCKFKIPREYNDLEGVYLLAVDDEVVYVGECENLEKRWNMGYGNISPRNCFKGGQETNCRINHYIFSRLKRGCRIDLYFHKTADRFNMESELIRLLSPIMNKTSGSIRRKKVRQPRPKKRIVPVIRSDRFGCREEILEATHQIIIRKGANEFTIKEVIGQMYENGTTYGESTIRTHIVSRMCDNSPDHHGTTYNDIHRIKRGLYQIIK